MLKWSAHGAASFWLSCTGAKQGHILAVLKNFGWDMLLWRMGNQSSQCSVAVSAQTCAHFILITPLNISKTPFSHLQGRARRRALSQCRGFCDGLRPSFWILATKLRLELVFSTSRLARDSFADSLAVVTDSRRMGQTTPRHET